MDAAYNAAAVGTEGGDVAAEGGEDGAIDSGDDGVVDGVVADDDHTCDVGWGDGIPAIEGSATVSVSVKWAAVVGEDVCGVSETERSGAGSEMG